MRNKYNKKNKIIKLFVNKNKYAEHFILEKVFLYFNYYISDLFLI